MPMIPTLLTPKSSEPRDVAPPSSPSRATIAVRPLDWAPAKLPPSTTVDEYGRQSPHKAAAPQVLLELAKQLELVEHQRQQILLKAQSNASAPPSPLRQRRPQSPVTPTLAPLSHTPSKATHTKNTLPSTSPSSLGLAPSLEVSDVFVCDMCAAELASSTSLRHHKVSCCPQRIVSCPRTGCGKSFAACDRPHHDRVDCTATLRTQQFLDAHQAAHTLIACDDCGQLTETRGLEDTHKLFHCGKRLIACQYESFGCTVRFAFDHTDVHNATGCRVALRRAKILTDAATVNETTQCDWCGQQVLKRKLLDHQEEQCPKRERPCPNQLNGCDEWVPAESVDDHLRTQCVVTLTRDAMAARAREMNMLVVCTECGAYVTRRHLIGHLNAECVSRIVRCKNAAHGCKAKLRWRDRHLHEDFMALATRNRSMLEFPVGGRAYMVVQNETSALITKTPVDWPPPWTLELFVWMASAPDEILELHRQCTTHAETLVAKQRELARFQQQASGCKKKLKQLKQLKTTSSSKEEEKDKRSNSQVLGEISLAAKQLADEFNAAETGIAETQKAIAWTKGVLGIALSEACRLLREEEKEEQQQQQKGENEHHQQGTRSELIKAAVASQAAQMISSKQLLQDELSELELARLSDLHMWANATSANAVLTPTEAADRKANEQRKLLCKRAELTELLAGVAAAAMADEADGGGTGDEDTVRLKRKYERALAKIDAKLALVSDNTPPELLARRGRHVILSSAKNAISLVGSSHGQITYYRSASSSSKSNAKPPSSNGEVIFPVSLARNRWHHVAFCASTTKELTLVVDGVGRGVKRGVFDLPFARVGTNDQLGDSFQGFLQEVRVWKSCLSVDYLNANASQIVHVGRRQGDLAAYYTFEEAMGDLVDDMALAQPRAPCFHTNWVLYDTPAVRTKFGVPMTPSLRDKTACFINQRLKMLAQRARDRETEPVPCQLNCGMLNLLVRDLDKHQRLECTNRTVVCDEPGCEKMFRFCDRKHHLTNDCERSTYREVLVAQYEKKEAMEKCILGCGATFKHRAQDLHYNEECANRLVACVQQDCGDTIVAKTMHMHLERECQSKTLREERQRVANARKRQQARKEAAAVVGTVDDASIPDSHD